MSTTHTVYTLSIMIETAPVRAEDIPHKHLKNLHDSCGFLRLLFKLSQPPRWSQTFRAKLICSSTNLPAFWLHFDLFEDSWNFIHFKILLIPQALLSIGWTALRLCYSVWPEMAAGLESVETLVWINPALNQSLMADWVHQRLKDWYEIYQIWTYLSI